MTDTSAVQLRRWTREEYDRMIGAGVLMPEDRVELIEGEILTMTPQGSAHVTAVSLAHDALRAEIGPTFHVRTQFPLALGAASEPEPDIAIVAGSVRDYRDQHPATAVLVIEIADSTLMYDRQVKGSLYARSGISEYWIVNLIEKLVEVYRDPKSDEQARFGFRYGRTERYLASDTITPQALPGARIPVADLLP
jgi:Uma2 family endonuclease